MASHLPDAEFFALKCAAFVARGNVFDSRREARDAAHKMARQKQAPIHHFRCTHCGKYHLGCTRNGKGRRGGR